MEIEADEYSHGHRAFLQAFLARGTLTFEESQPIIAAIVEAASDGAKHVRPDQVTEKDFESYVQAVSDATSLFDYEIRSTLDQLNKQRVYAFVNTTSDPQTQLATTYNAEELAFIRRVLDGIFDKYNTPRMEVLAITEMQAIKFARPSRRPDQTAATNEESSQAAASGNKGLKHSEVEQVLRSLVNGGWFKRSKSGFYSLTPRALLELRPWLMDVYNDSNAGPDEWQHIKLCEACKDVVTTGLRCTTPTCTLRLHDICQEAFWRASRSTACPRCSHEWTGSKYVGERAVTMTQAYQRGRKRNGGGRNTLADDIMEQEVMEDHSDDVAEDEEAV